MNRLLNVAWVSVVVAGGLVGCRGQQNADQVQAPPPPDPMLYAGAQPAPFEPVQVQTGEPQPLPMDPYVGGGATGAGTQAPAMGGGNYTVQRGDTLWSIAQRHYGNGQRWVDIVNANPGLDPNKLPVGRAIVLP